MTDTIMIRLRKYASEIFALVGHSSYTDCMYMAADDLGRLNLDLLKSQATVTAMQIERDELRAELSKAEAVIADLMEGYERLMVALTTISECDVRRPVSVPWNSDAKPSKHDICQHGAFVYADCDSCTAEFARDALLNEDKIRQGVEPK